jgi:Zn-dependent peptidase ImmA (M78 family)
MKLADARALIAPYQSTVPIDPKFIAEQIGLRVWEFNDMPDTVSGKLFADSVNGGRAGFSIGVNASEGYRRKRFTIAHELAHYLLHRDLITNGILVDDTLYRSGLTSHEETQANKLAADILMPYSLLNALVSQGITDVSELANRFKVSLPAMKIRLNIPNV